MEFLLTLLVRAINNPWSISLIVMATGFLLYGLSGAKHRSLGKVIMLTTVAVAMLSGTLLSLLGHFLTVPIIHAIGVPSKGHVLSFYKTGDIYNERDVIAFKVVYPFANGQLIESHFKSNDFNLFPIRNTAHYPQVGTSFKLKYLARSPQQFIILTDS
ncbi:MAG: hypothetical protein Q4G44_08975 [Alcaligenaceae bacterium]|nr:hypothetical protein [Alcaligenaceae bacterium]